MFSVGVCDCMFPSADATTVSAYTAK